MRRVNAAVHSEIPALPAERLLTERTLLGPLPSLRPALAPTAVRAVDKLRTVCYGSDRYSVPGGSGSTFHGLRPIVGT